MVSRCGPRVERRPLIACSHTLFAPSPFPLPSSSPSTLAPTSVIFLPFCILHFFPAIFFSLSLSPLLLFLPPSPRPSRTFSSNILFFFLFRKNEFFLSLFVTSIFFFFFFFFAPSNLFFFVISVFFLLLSFLLTTILYFSSFFLLEYLELPLLFLSFFVHSTSISYILPLRSPPRVYPLPPPPSTTSTRMSHDFSQTLAPSSSLPLRTYNVQLPEDQITRGMGEALYARYAITKPRSHWSTREWMVGREEAWPEKRC